MNCEIITKSKLGEEEIFPIYKTFLDNIWEISLNKIFLKSDPHLPKKCVICFIESPLKMMKNAFYFILKALFVLKIFKFLSRLFGHVEKTVGG